MSIIDTTQYASKYISHNDECTCTETPIMHDTTKEILKIVETRIREPIATLQLS
jgi:hypothetical protein